MEKKRLIDANEFVQSLIHCKGLGRQSLTAVLEHIEKQPTIEAKSVRHGKWILHHIGVGHYWECSECHENPCIYVTEKTNYCPNCGARMDGDNT